jgi:hypothetical protein
VGARSAAPLVVVVQRGQVVVDQREGVYELDRRGGGKRIVERSAGGLRDRETEDRPDPLSARLEGVAHRRFEPAELGRERQRAQVRLDGVAQLVSRLHRPGCGRA